MRPYSGQDMNADGKGETLSWTASAHNMIFPDCSASKPISPKQSRDFSLSKIDMQHYSDN